MTSYLEFPELPLLSGDERLLPGVTVRDFWKWSLGDLRLNSTRGLLAQFLVAAAVGDTRRVDDGWGPFDVLSETGIKIEVKSAGYLQSWRQTSLSLIRFSGLITKRGDKSDGYRYGPDADVVADVYVFAVHACRTPEMYDPLDVDSWEFYVLLASTIRTLDQKSMALSTVQRYAGSPLAWNQLRGAIHSVHAKQLPTSRSTQD